MRSVHSIILAGDPGIALPSMAQLQVAQEEKHRKHFTDFCTRKYYREGDASCVYIITEVGAIRVQLTLFGGSLSVP